MATTLSFNSNVGGLPKPPTFDLPTDAAADIAWHQGREASDAIGKLIEGIDKVNDGNMDDPRTKVTLVQMVKHAQALTEALNIMAHVWAHDMSGYLYDEPFNAQMAGIDHRITPGVVKSMRAVLDYDIPKEQADYESLPEEDREGHVYTHLHDINLWLKFVERMFPTEED